MTIAARRRIVRSDILPIAEYGRIRREQRQHISAIKRLRRIEVGPYATFYFENFDTMWHQVHEMLFVEKGGEEQIQGELDAYNPLIPNGDELIATVMFEIDDPRRRAIALHAIGGIERHVVLSIGGETIRGQADVVSAVRTLHADAAAKGALRRGRPPGDARFRSSPLRPSGSHADEHTAGSGWRSGALSAPDHFPKRLRQNVLIPATGEIISKKKGRTKAARV